jgi:hypothetical protein
VHRAVKSPSSVQKRARLQSGLHFVGAAKPLKHQVFLDEKAHVSSPSPVLWKVNGPGGEEQCAHDRPPASGPSAAEDRSAIAGSSSAGQLVKLSRCVFVWSGLKICSCAKRWRSNKRCIVMSKPTAAVPSCSRAATLQRLLPCSCTLHCAGRQGCNMTSWRCGRSDLHSSRTCCQYWRSNSC